MGRKGTGTVGEGARGTVRDSQKVSAGSWGSSPAEGLGWEGFGMFAGLRELPEACRELLLDKGGQQVITVREELYFCHVFPQQEIKLIQAGKASSAAPSQWHFQV